MSVYINGRYHSGGTPFGVCSGALSYERSSNYLTSIGGSGSSYLAKLRLGLRAIETETGHLTNVQVTKLNGGS